MMRAMPKGNARWSTARQRIALLAVAGVAPVAPPCPGAAPTVASVRHELARFPASGPQDVYKLLFQMSLGSEHATHDPAMAREWLAREWSTLAPLPAGEPAEPLVDTLGGGPYARVNLRPYRNRGGTEPALLAAFLKTGEMHGSRATLRCREAAVVRTARRERWPIGADALGNFFAAQHLAGDTAVDHSAPYEQRYAPAYRVVGLSELKSLGLRP